MTQNSTQNMLRQGIIDLAVNLVMASTTGETAEWRDRQANANLLAQALYSDGSGVVADIAEKIASLCKIIADATLPEPKPARTLLRELMKLLLDFACGHPQSHACMREACARTNLFLKDLQEEERRHQEAQSDQDPEIEEELREEIVRRQEGLEQLLFNTALNESDPEKVRAVFREFHTLKGESAIVGLKNLSEFYHAVESQIEAARYGNLTLTTKIVEALIELSQIGNAILRRDTSEFSPDAIHNAKNHLKTAVDNMQADSAASESAPPAKSAPVAEKVPPVDIDDDFFFPPAAPETEKVEIDDDFFAAAKPIATNFTTDLAADTTTNSTSDTAAQESDNRLTDSSQSEADDFFATATPITAMPSLLASVLPPPPPSPPQELVKPAASESSDSGITGMPVEKAVNNSSLHVVNVEVRRLDVLLEIVGEVTLIASGLSEKEGYPELRILSGLCNNLQDMAVEFRMTPVQPLFLRAQRAAYEAARSQRRTISVTVEGSDVTIDRSSFEHLNAAMIHIVRNAVDHGIEPPEERRELGKNSRGIVHFKAMRRGNEVIVEVGDDGRGIDADKVRRKAIERGIIKPDAILTTKEVLELIFAPGFSTADKLTSVSGRGVGLEVVTKSMDALRGNIQVDSTLGKGSVMRLIFPVARAAVEGLLARIGKEIVAFPVSAVRENLVVKREQIRDIAGQGRVISVRGVPIPLLHLGAELGFTSDNQDPDRCTVVMLADGERLVAVLVDEVIETRQLLVKPIEGEMFTSPLVTGAALLPDRRVAVVLEARRLLDATSALVGSALERAGSEQAAAEQRIEIVSIGSNQVGMIDFSLCGVNTYTGEECEYIYAINAFKAREFVIAKHLVPIPGAPEGFAGMMYLRDQAFPVMALAKLLNLPFPKDNNDNERIVVICEFSGKTVGFLVSHVNRVSYITWTDIQPPPNASETAGIRMEFIVGAILGNCFRHDSGVRALTTQNDVVFVLDFERIVQTVIPLYSSEMDATFTAELMGNSNLLDDNSSGQDSTQTAVMQRQANRILLVEDSNMIRRETKKALNMAGFEVIEATNGQEALDKIHELLAQAKAAGQNIFATLDLVLSDIEMPAMDGYTLTYTLKHDAELRLLPVLLHSSITNDTVISRAREVEADGFVPKCDPKELAVQLKKYL